MIMELPVIVILYGVLLCLYRVRRCLTAFCSNLDIEAGSLLSLLRLRRQTSTTSVILIP